MTHQILRWCVFTTSRMLVQYVLLKVRRTGLHYLICLTPCFAVLSDFFVISTCPFKTERVPKCQPAIELGVFGEDCPLEMRWQCAHLPFPAQKVSLQMVLVEEEPRITQGQYISLLSHTRPPHEHGRVGTLPAWCLAKILFCKVSGHLSSAIDDTLMI